jgi:hypothetical protein
MQRIAKEMNFSETTFILSETQREGGVRCTYFHSPPGGTFRRSSHIGNSPYY